MDRGKQAQAKIKEVVAMLLSMKFILGLVICSTSEGKVLTWQEIERHVPEQLRKSEAVKGRIQKQLKMLERSKTIKQVPGGWTLRTRKR